MPIELFSQIGWGVLDWECALSGAINRLPHTVQAANTWHRAQVLSRPDSTFRHESPYRAQQSQGSVRGSIETALAWGQRELGGKHSRARLRPPPLARSTRVRSGGVGRIERGKGVAGGAFSRNNQQDS